MPLCIEGERSLLIGRGTLQPMYPFEIFIRFQIANCLSTR